MTAHRKMHLVAFLLAGPTAHHHGAWRHPEADLGMFTPEWHEHIARVLEQGKFDSLFFADILGLYDLYGGSFATILRCGGQMGLLDPIPLLSIMSRATSRIGLGATLSSTFYPPYHLARSLGTLDLLSGGRVAWNVVASHGHLEAQNFGLNELPSRDMRYDYADEVVEAVCKLWESWDADALVFDKRRGVFADPDKVHYANYQGRWISTRGPLTVPRSPQGRPVIMQAGSSPRGRDFAARWGELVFTLQHSKADMQAFYQDLKSRVVAQGRAPEQCLILPSIDVIIGETDAGGQLVTVGVSPQIGRAAGGVIGYDFVGPRVELEGVYRQNQTNLSANNFNTNFGTAGTSIGQLGILANLLYDFSPGSTITPYIGAGAGVGFVDGTSSLSSTVFAYQGIIGVGYNIDPISVSTSTAATTARPTRPQRRWAWTNNNFA